LNDEVGRGADSDAASQRGVLNRHHVELVLIVQQADQQERGRRRCAQRQDCVDDDTILKKRNKQSIYIIYIRVYYRLYMYTEAENNTEEDETAEEGWVVDEG